ncbi:MAG: helix-turn-helix domain-containing protein [Oscillospiraceae bacterium]|nr:helix-turn-helix domain-containing protein [Oscillospiraceae bacterium]
MNRILDINDIGSLVKQKRNQLNMTQSQLATVSGAGVRFLSDLENGKPTMQIGKILEILHVLGLDVYILERGTSV